MKNKKNFIEKKFESIFWYLNRKGHLNWVTDKCFLKIMYKIKTDKSLNLIEPKLFNEKLQWLKLYFRNPIYSELVDKYKVRTFIEKKIGEEYLIPLLGVWDKPDSIEWDKLPNQFVLKCTHDSGGIIICKDKSKLDISEVKQNLTKLLNKNYYFAGREWPYKNVTPKIIAEKLMVDESGYELKDYKFFCFNGIPKVLQVDFNRTQHHERNMYDLDWNLLDVEFNFPKDVEKKINKPEQFDKMIELAKIISENMPFVRVDFYSINEKLYFGEITFYPESGFGKFTPDNFNNLFGKWLKLPLDRM